MAVSGKDVIIGILILIVLLMIFGMGRRLSFADMMAPAPGPVALPSSAQLPSGSVLGKAVSEDCATKYGAGWSKFTDTLCKKS